MKPMFFVVPVVVMLAALALWALRSRAPSGADLPVRELPPGAVQAALAPHQAALDASRRPVLGIRLEEFPADELLASKVGGSAWWPEGTARPVAADGSNLALLAQINFAELPASPDYPAQGLLQFFIAGNDYYGANFDGEFTVENLSTQRNYRVVYWPETTTPAQALAPEADDRFMTPHEPGKPRRMLFTPGSEVFSSTDYRFDRLFGDGGAYAALEAWATAHGHGDELIDGVYEHLDGSGHKFGGYPHFTQQDPRSAGPLELLLQLDSDEHMMWGDVGVGAFFIDPGDLARGDFSRVMYHWDCH